MYPHQTENAIELHAKREADKKVESIFKDSKIDDWLIKNRGSTYVIIQLELKLAAQRMFKYEYLIEYHQDKICRLEKQRDKLAFNIGKLKVNLYRWQLKNDLPLKSLKHKKFSLLLLVKDLAYNIKALLIAFCGVVFPTLELILKSGLSLIVVISLLGITGVLPKDGGIMRSLQEPSKLIFILAITFAGISLVHFLSAYIYYDFMYSQKDLGQSGRGFLRMRIRRRFYNVPDPTTFPLTSWIHKLIFRNSQKSGRIIKSLDWQITQRELFLLFIFLSESFLGYEGITHLYTIPFDNGNLASTMEWYNHLAIGLSSGVYALVNMAFSIAKAKRNIAILPKQEQYFALTEKKESIILAIQEAQNKIIKSNQEYKRYKNDYESLLHKTGGIIAQINLLSIDAYEDSNDKINSDEPLDFEFRNLF
jgi:hypothetical protein